MLVSDIQLLKILLKLVHADIEVGKVTDVNAILPEKQLDISVTAFKLEGNVTLNKDLQPLNAELKLVTIFIEVGAVILVNR